MEPTNALHPVPLEHLGGDPLFFSNLHEVDYLHGCSEKNGVDLSCPQGSVAPQPRVKGRYLRARPSRRYVPAVTSRPCSRRPSIKRSIRFPVFLKGQTPSFRTRSHCFLSNSRQVLGSGTLNVRAPCPARAEKAPDGFGAANHKSNVPERLRRSSAAYRVRRVFQRIRVPTPVRRMTQSNSPERSR